MKRLWILAIIMILSIVPAIAQDTDDDGTTIEFTGEVTIIDATTIEVAGLTVDISGLDDEVVTTLEDGVVITIAGNMEGTIVVAITVESGDDDEDPEATEVPDAETTPEPEGSEVDEGSEASGDDDVDVQVTIVIEGPVSEIEGNVVIIYGFHIELDEDDPRLIIIAIGDVLRIEGVFGDSDGGTIIIIAIFFDFVSIEVYILDDLVWRDPENCQNPPPPWAPAHGWRARCESSAGSGGSGRGGRGGRGRSGRS